VVLSMRRESGQRAPPRRRTRRERTGVDPGARPEARAPPCRAPWSSTTAKA